MARDSLGHRRKLHRVTFAMHFVHIVYCSIHGGFILSLNSKRGAFFSGEAIVETCAVSRLFFFPSIYRLLRGRFSLNSKRKAFFSRWLESMDTGWHSLISRPPSKAAPCYRCTGTMHFLPRRPPFFQRFILFSVISSSLRPSSFFSLFLSLPLLFDPSHYGSFCARMNAAVHRRFHDNGTGHSERHKY